MTSGLTMTMLLVCIKDKQLYKGIWPWGKYLLYQAVVLQKSIIGAKWANCMQSFDTITENAYHILHLL